MKILRPYPESPKSETPATHDAISLPGDSDALSSVRTAFVKKRLSF